MHFKTFTILGALLLLFLTGCSYTPGRNAERDNPQTRENAVIRNICAYDTQNDVSIQKCQGFYASSPSGFRSKEEYLRMKKEGKRVEIDDAPHSIFDEQGAFIGQCGGLQLYPGFDPVCAQYPLKDCVEVIASCFTLPNFTKTNASGVKSGEEAVKRNNWLATPASFSCDQDTDCQLVDTRFASSCCWEGVCEPVDYSQNTWIAVNGVYYGQDGKDIVPLVRRNAVPRRCARRGQSTTRTLRAALLVSARRHLSSPSIDTPNYS